MLLSIYIIVILLSVINARPSHKAGLKRSHYSYYPYYYYYYYYDDDYYYYPDEDEGEYNEQPVSSEVSQACKDEQVINANQGSITSDGFKDDGSGRYASKSMCKWTINVDQGKRIQLTFDNFDLETGANTDRVTVYDGQSKNDRYISQYYGSNIPSPIQSTGSSLHIIFSSNNGLEKNGFKLSWTVIADDQASECRGVVDLFTNQPVFTSPGYSSPYPNNAACSWRLIASEGQNIVIKFEAFNLQDSSSCLSDYVKVHAGGFITSNVVAKRCGKLAPFEIYVRSNKAVVHFASDSSGSSEGFKATWSARNPVPVTCGLPDASFQIKPKRNTNARIVGGAIANPHSLPWQIALKSYGGFSCGGTIIHPLWILTAAHCITESSGYSISAGVHSRRSNDNVQNRDVIEIIKHPKWNTNTLNADLALLKLESSLQFNKYVDKICLADKDAEIGTDCLASGWGLTASGSLSDQLRQVYLPITSRQFCSKHLGNGQLTEYMFCAGHRLGGIDTCQGDSGGPLVCPDLQTGAWKLQGATSWGVDCGKAGFPGISTRLIKFLPWIRSKIPDL